MSTKGEDTIAARQNAAENLRLIAAARQRYSDARRMHSLRLLGTVGLAAVAPVVLIVAPHLGPTLGALAGGWIFLARTVLAHLERRGADSGRRLQEEFDCAVLGILPNDHLGRRPTQEAIASAAQRFGDDRSELRDRYPAEELSNTLRDSLICQRSSVAWGERLHSEYAWVIGATAVGWAVVGSLVALQQHAELGQYLVTIFLPSLPALLDAAELVQAHGNTSRAKGSLEEEMTSALKSEAVTPATCRGFQDRLFNQRATDPVVATWYYRLRRSAYERHMREAARELASDEGYGYNNQ